MVMKLQDVRKFAVRKRTRVRFGFGESLECVVNEHGLATVPSPGVAAQPPFDLEAELASAGRFSLEPAQAVGAKARTISRAELESLLDAAASPAAEHSHDDE